MIPNTFDGVVINSSEIKDTKFTIGYLAKQKSRDHQDSNFLLTYGDENSTKNVNRPE